MLKLENLSFSYGKIQAIRDVSLEIKKGEIIKKVPEHELLSVLREELLKMQEMQK